MDYRNQWEKDNKDRIIVMVNKGDKEKYKARAKEVGAKSLNAYIVSLIEEDIKKGEV